MTTKGITVQDLQEIMEYKLFSELTGALAKESQAKRLEVEKIMASDGEVLHRQIELDKIKQYAEGLKFTMDWIVNNVYT